MDNNKNEESAAQYMDRKCINQLFHSFMTALVHHRPSEPVKYLIQCMKYIRDQGISPAQLVWNSFLHLTPQEHDEIQSKNPQEASAAVDRGISQEDDSQQHPTGTQPYKQQLSTEQPQYIPQLSTEQPQNKQQLSTEQIQPTEQPRYKQQLSTEQTQPTEQPRYKQQLSADNVQDPNTMDSSSKPTSSEGSSRYQGQVSMVESVGGDTDGPDAEEEEMVVELDEGEVTHLPPHVTDILRGSLNHLPPIPSNIVRIFLSSTFSDFKAERNILPRKAYPELQKFCSERGLDFQVVDMRWGVTDDVMNDHQVSALCLQEIITCQQVSCGPNFVMLLGNRYGWQPFPARIDSYEFETLRSIASKSELEGFTYLNEWFLEDVNNVPPQYVLQPIHSRLEYYNDTSPENADKRAAHKAIWNGIYDKLQSVLRQAMETAVTQGLLSKDCKRKYFNSVTEEEIEQGLDRSQQPRTEVLCYMRDLQGIGKRLTDQDITRFVDIKQGHIDQLCLQLREELLAKTVKPKLGQENIKNYEVLWQGTALEKSHADDHTYYLEHFCEDFVTDMKAIIEKGLTQREDDNSEITQVYQEVMHHARFAKNKIQIFCGRTKELLDVKEYVTSQSSSRAPYVISGRSGYGKTALLAYVGASTEEWLGPHVVRVMRFLGTSPDSSNINDVLKSITLQLCINFNLQMPRKGNVETFGDVRRRFYRILEHVSKMAGNEPLVIILDSLDQLHKSRDVVSMSWLPKLLPQNIYFIVSVLSERPLLVENIKKRISNIRELEPLSEDSGDEMIKLHLSTKKRNLTAVQRQAVKDVFKQCSQPLFLKLMMDSAKTWHSYTPISHEELATDATSAIIILFDNLEVKHGKTFVQHALGYLTCGLGGLTGVEMEDVLSCDDNILNEVYQYHDPPLEGIIRIPSLMWSRVQFALRDYITEKRVDGKVVMTWFHRQFWEAAEHRYLSDTEQEIYLHKHLSELFLQENGIKRTIKLHLRRGKVMEDADRCVSHQPLVVRNIRKLNAAPYHLIKAGQLNAAKEKCLLNFNWVYIKMHALDVTFLVKEYDSLVESADFTADCEVNLLRDLLTMCIVPYFSDPTLLAYHVTQRLSKYASTGACVEKFISDAGEFLRSSTVPLLLPVHPVKFQSPASPIKLDIMLGCAGSANENGMYLAAIWQGRTNSKCKVQVMDLSSKDLVMSAQADKVVYTTMNKENTNLYYCDTTFLYVRELISGDKIKQFRYFDGEYDKVTVRCQALSDSGRYMAVGFRLGKPKEVSKTEVWKTQVILSLIDLEGDGILHSTPCPIKKPLDNLTFLHDDTKILASAKNVITLYDVNGLNIVSKYETNGELQPHTVCFLNQAICLVGTTMSTERVSILKYNHVENKGIYSKNVHFEDSKGIVPFACHSDSSGTKIIAGIYKEYEIPETSICVWNSDCDSYQRAPLSHQWYKRPSTMAVMPNRTYAFVGWLNGNITVVDLNSMSEVSVIKVQSLATTFMKVVQDGRYLITLAFDNSFKLWDTKLLVAKSLEEAAIPEVQREEISEELDEDEQCLEVVTAGPYVITAPQNSLQGPRYWYLQSGHVNRTMTEKLTREYQEILEAKAITHKTRTHGVVIPYGDLLIYQRKRRNNMAVCIIKDHLKPVISATKFFESSFFSLFAEIQSTSSDCLELKCLIIRDGVLEVCSMPSLDKEDEIDIPPISKDIPNISSSGGKRKLLFTKIATTLDGKYFLITNLTYRLAHMNYKALDIVDLKSRKLVQRFQMPTHLRWDLLNSLAFLCWNVSKNETPELLAVRMYKERNESFEYEEIVDTGEFLSADKKLGLEIDNKNNIVYLWRLSPLEQIQTFQGHLHEISSADISFDNRYLATGSHDKTAVLWSIATGERLATFYCEGGVDNVKLDRTMNYLVVNCYASPQQKRAISLKILNV